MPQLEPDGPLAGIRVVDLTLALAGPAAGQRLADLGADVIKVEPVPDGEWSRSHPIKNAFLGGQATTYLSFNRNKRSLAVDLKDPRGRDLMERLLAQSDVLLTNYRTGALERLGLDGASTLERHPSLIHAAVNGYGLDGPDRDRPGQDLLLQAYSGLTWMYGRAGDPPHPSPLFVADVITAHAVTEGILAALIERSRTGRGRIVSVSMLHTLLDSMLQELVTFLNNGIEPTRTAEPLAHVFINPPYGFFPTQDGWMAIAMADPVALAAALESEALAAYPSWAAAAQDRDGVYRAVAAETPRRTTADWLAILGPAGIWAGPVHTYAQVAEHPQVLANGMIGTFELPGHGPVRVPSNPIRMVGHETPMRPPPAVGEHGREIAQALGLDDAAIDDLVAAGVMVVTGAPA